MGLVLFLAAAALIAAAVTAGVLLCRTRGSDT
jgi:hypothetical protein